MTPLLLLSSFSLPYQLESFQVVHGFQSFPQATIRIRLPLLSTPSHTRQGMAKSSDPAFDIARHLTMQVQLQWPDTAGECLFLGRVRSISVEHVMDGFIWTLDCISCGYSICGERSIFRSFQKNKQTLRDIIQQIKDSNDHNFDYKIYGSLPVLDWPHYMGLQNGQTDFDFLAALLGNFGIPIYWNDQQDALIIGWENGEEDTVKKYSFDQDPYLSLLNSTYSQQRQPPGLCQTTLTTHWQQPHLLRGSPIDAHWALAEAEEWLEFSTRNQYFKPGDLLQYPNGRYLRVIHVEYRYSPGNDELSVKIAACCNESRRYWPEAVPLPAPKCLAKVTKTSQDPEHLGRIQVQFGFDPFSVINQSVWLPVLTSYQGQYAGLWVLPEPGNQVIVECLDPYRGLWAITSTLRTQSPCESPDSIRYSELEKCLQTSKNNQLLFTASPSSTDPVCEEIKLINGQNILTLHYGHSGMKMTIEQAGKQMLRVVTENNNSSIQLTVSHDIDIRSDTGT
ncbi:MAG: phage baseplate assembly protein V, partial [Methylococcaceae bacterium]